VILKTRILTFFARVAAAEGWFIYRADWDQAVEDAQDRNNAG
jgi:MATE family multidrug resistance protein